jgi:Family of unknown function (DUF5522)
MTTALIEGDDFYYNEQGFFVFTADWHLKKGYCCGNGCLHCPFDYRNVPEPQKNELLLSKTGAA